jgi:hypothetical protein
VGKVSDREWRFPVDLSNQRTRARKPSARAPRRSSMSELSATADGGVIDGT